MAVQLICFDDFNREDVMLAYKDLLTDVNHCINLFVELNARSSLTQSVSDWAVGERTIDFDSVIVNLKIFKTELEKGIQLHSDVCVKLHSFAMIDKSYRKRIEDSDSADITSELKKNHKDFLQSVNGDYDALFIDVAKLKRTGVFDEKYNPEMSFSSFAKSGIEIGTLGILGGGGVMGLSNLTGASVKTALASAGSSQITTSVATTAVGFLKKTGGTLAVGGVTASVVAAGAGLIGCVAYCYAHPKGKERGIKYKHLKVLSDALNTNQLLAEFQTRHISIDSILNRINKTLEMCIEHFENSIIQSKNSPENIMTATRIYFEVMQDSLQMLLVTETDMKEAMRKRMATNSATIACKAFLKRTLGYSDSNADKFIQNLQK